MILCTKLCNLVICFPVSVLNITFWDNVGIYGGNYQRIRKIRLHASTPCGLPYTEPNSIRLRCWDGLRTKTYSRKDMFLFPSFSGMYFWFVISLCQSYISFEVVLCRLRCLSSGVIGVFWSFAISGKVLSQNRQLHVCCYWIRYRWQTPYDLHLR